jgi:glycolate oxidase
MNDILQLLIEIVGKNGVSNSPEELWYYARDPGVLEAHPPDFVVAPKTTEEVQKIVLLANRENIPIVPMGNGMSLTGLVIPLKGGIVLDMKRMNKIVEVNPFARYAVVEGGTSQGMLKAYLLKNHPGLRHSLPDAPAATTIAANVSLHGQGRLTQQYGFNSDMVTGLEVVLPTGEICRIGSSSLGPYWFSKGPSLPDLSGLPGSSPRWG